MQKTGKEKNKMPREKVSTTENGIQPSDESVCEVEYHSANKPFSNVPENNEKNLMNGDYVIFNMLESKEHCIILLLSMKYIPVRTCTLLPSLNGMGKIISCLMKVTLMKLV